MTVGRSRQLGVVRGQQAVLAVHCFCGIWVEVGECVDALGWAAGHASRHRCLGDRSSVLYDGDALAHERMPGYVAMQRLQGGHTAAQQ